VMSRGVPPPDRGRTFRRVRIGLLLGVLLFTAAWGAGKSWQRWPRGNWRRPLQVGLVLLSPGTDVGTDRWRRRADDLAAHLDGEMARWRGRGGSAFQITVAGPVGWSGTLPFSPASEAPLDRATHALDVWRTVRDIDRAAGGVVGGFDVRIFFLCAPLPEGQVGFAEGSGAVNGEVAFVRGSCDGDLTLSLLAVGHELLHLVGATDRYDAGGHARGPGDLADPDRVPLYPQTHAEWMVGEVPIAPGRGRLPESLEELRVGPVTAREIGWVE
jgi:hypothetical protein